jgi:hypothetical protein
MSPSPPGPLSHPLPAPGRGGTQAEPVRQIEPLRTGKRPPSPGWGERVGEGARG